MEIKTKYDIGHKVWCAELSAQNGVKTIDLASGIITGINIENGRRISYFFDEWCADYYEEDVIAYEDTETLIKRLKELDDKRKGE